MFSNNIAMNKNWKEKIVQILKTAKDKVVEIDLDNKTVTYNKINNPRGIKIITGDEEIVRAYLVNRLVNELDYSPELIDIEVEYDMGRPSVKKARIDILVRERSGNAFYFIEVKSPDKWESDKEFIEGQLFKLVKQQDESKYLVYYTIDDRGTGLSDQAIVIDYIKYRDYEQWDEAGRQSISNELSAGYGKPRKIPYVKGDKRKDLRTNFTHDEIISLGRNLHNVLWGGGGTSDTEVFNSLVNIILAKIQDEDEKINGQQFDFQIFGFDDGRGNFEIEKPEKVFERINALYRKALKQKLNFTDANKLEKTYVIDEEKFPLSKLIYTVQQLEDISFIEGRSQVDGTDILGDFFEQITRDGFKQTKGQFFTPINIVRFILYGLSVDNLSIQMLNDKQILPYVIDPACGSGTFLIEAMKVITKEIKHKRKNEIDTSNQVLRWFNDYFPEIHENRWARDFLYGMDSNFDLGTAAKVNMILHGDGSANLFVQDGLLPFTMYNKSSGGTNVLIVHEQQELYANKRTNGQFDILISNPPFSIELDLVTKQKIERTFVFHKKKNSENLFIERYYQLLKENGRMGIVLPESVFDTTENKYIRLFLFKYFKVKAVVSLPQITFEPFTSTKTSLLFAQKKTAGEVEVWNKHWNKYQSEWSKLNTRVANYISVYLNGEKKEKYPSIKADDDKAAIKNIHYFLKDYLEPMDASLPVKELLKKYKAEIEEVSSIDKDTLELFGHCNSWWVFGEVSKEIDYNIFMAEAENVGYKRTKRGPKPMPNELFDIEAAPLMLDTLKVEKYFSEIVEELKASIEETEKAINAKKKKVTNPNGKGRNSDKADYELEKEEKKLKRLKAAYITEQSNLKEAKAALSKYYDENVLKEKFYERIEKALVDLFTTGILSIWKSEDVLLRKTEKIKLLDHFRQTVKWQ